MTEWRKIGEKTHRRRKKTKNYQLSSKMKAVMAELWIKIQKEDNKKFWEIQKYKKAQFKININPNLNKDSKNS